MRSTESMIRSNIKIDNLKSKESIKSGYNMKSKESLKKEHRFLHGHINVNKMMDHWENEYAVHETAEKDEDPQWQQTGPQFSSDIAGDGPDHGGVEDSSDYDDIPFSDESSSIDESNIVDTVASDTQSDQGNGLVNGDSSHSGIRDSSKFYDLELIGESSSIESNSVNIIIDSESDLDTVASNSQSDQENGLVNGDSHHREAKDDSKFDDLQFYDESSSIDESSLVDITSGSECDLDNVASSTQSDQENGIVNGDSHHRGSKGSSGHDDMVVRDESSSIDESNLVDTTNESECNEENGLVNGYSPAYCDFQISGKSSSPKDDNSDCSDASCIPYNQDYEKKLAKQKYNLLTNKRRSKETVRNSNLKTNERRSKETVRNNLKTNERRSTDSIKTSNKKRSTD